MEKEPGSLSVVACKKGANPRYTPIWLSSLTHTLGGLSSNSLFSSHLLASSLEKHHLGHSSETTRSRSNHTEIA